MVRIKNRYLLVNILYPENELAQKRTQQVPDVVAFNQPTTDNLTAQALLRMVRAEVAFYFGDHGAGAISESLSVKYLSHATSTFILRVSRAHYKFVWAALSLTTTVPVNEGKGCIFSVVRVSGTMRKAEEEAIRRARQNIIKATRIVPGDVNSTLETILGKPESTVDVDMLNESVCDEEEENSMDE
ncbi:unnamed protein product [Blumeria hordei]|uniref:Ribonuclease P/MRP protein subunit POP5 n=2 Tax=Blumeria hordei TaxID=2867405 RepID=A0A383UJM2_BLUHO|nr:Ribonuclease P/MRP protein subunit POP5 [Blumeria hordei DH14]SZE99495.1 unnamed protein product [Blumeria hordei]